MSDRVARFDRSVARALAGDAITDVIKGQAQQIQEIRAKFTLLESVFEGIARDIEALERRCQALETRTSELIARVETTATQTTRSWWGR